MLLTFCDILKIPYTFHCNLESTKEQSSHQFESVLLLEKVQFTRTCGYLKRNNFNAMDTVPSRIISANTGQCFEVILVLHIIRDTVVIS